MNLGLVVMIMGINAYRYLVQLDNVVQSRIHREGPVLFKRQSFPGMINKVIMFEDQTTIAVVESDYEISELQNYEGVVAVEPDYLAQASWFDQTVFEYENDSQIVCQNRAPWHLARLNYRQWMIPGINRTVFGNSEGKAKLADVEIFVVDSGIQLDHPEFRGRVRPFFSNQQSKSPHGTHVAGLILGRTFGVAKNAVVNDVHVLDSNGSGSYSAILEGLAFISRTRNTDKKCIVNMSLGGPFSRIVNRIVESLMYTGCVVVVAAGNNGDDACKYSPSSADVISVGATGPDDKIALFSNYGTCVDILAPGDNIQSSYPTNNTSFMSGTSMAAPIVAGIAAFYLTLEPPANPYALRFKIMSDSTRGVIDVRGRKDQLSYFSFFPYSSLNC